ncbi:MAG TPA: LamG domain-containing protein, partial [Verrucomicrobium sp.]|nr:LamG domain-containing protein [Verrucomicrobium sp.]
SAWYYMEIGGPHSGDKRLFVYESKGDYDLSYAIQAGATSTDGTYEGTVYTSANNPNSYSVGNAGYFNSADNLGAWNHVVETFSSDGTTVTKLMYLNGELAGTTTMPHGSLSSAGINLGTYRSANDRYWDGFLDEVGLWKRALSSEEIAALYELNYFEGRSVTSLAPEPSRAALMMAAFAALSLRRNRRRP